jgi:hypothetical protein
MPDCEICGTPLVKKPGVGRWPKACSESCRAERKRRGRRSQATGRPRGRPRTVPITKIGAARHLLKTARSHGEVERELGLPKGTIRNYFGPSPNPRGGMITGGEWSGEDGRVYVALVDPIERTWPTFPRGSGRRAHAVWNRAHPDDLVQPGEHVHHVNGDPSDDRIENLEKLTPAEHADRHRDDRRAAMRQMRAAWEADPDTRRRRIEGLRAAGRAKSALTLEQVGALRRRYAGGGVTHAELACEFGVSKSQVGRILRGEQWDDRPVSPESRARRSESPVGFGVAAARAESPSGGAR